MKKPIIMTLMFFTIFVTKISAEEASGYLKKDVYVNKWGTVYKGKEVRCTVNDKKCCMATHYDDICINLEDISKNEVQKIDLSITDVTYSDYRGLDACEAKSSINQLPDSYKWSYGFKIQSSEQIPDEVMVEISHILKSRNGILYSLSMSKKWTGKADGKCHTINFYNDDVDKFLDSYNKYRNYIDIEIEDSINSIVSFKLYSKRPENDYSNNVVEIESIIPADGSITWPKQR